MGHSLENYDDVNEVMVDQNKDLYDRVYLPPLQRGGDVKEYLDGYIKREFPVVDAGNATYSIPTTFKRWGERQASKAEEIVFERLRSLAKSDTIDGLWMMFVHNVSYGGHSNRNQRVGKLMIREHDFVIFVQYKGRKQVAFIEVKSTHDSHTFIPDVTITSDAKVIKNNKRSAQHQLRDHYEILQPMIGTDNSKLIQQYIFWPFLGELTRDPKQMVIKRWKEDHNLHVFEHTLAYQKLFDEWFEHNVLGGACVGEEYFVMLLNRYLILSCSVFVDEIRKGMLALLTQEQYSLLNTDICQINRTPVIAHGPAGSGKTLLILRKLKSLHEQGFLDDNNRALFICYWPGIKVEVEHKLNKLGLRRYVDTTRFYITQTGVLNRNKSKQYRHVFMDETEVISLCYDSHILKKLVHTLYECYHGGNCSVNYLECQLNGKHVLDSMAAHNTVDWGEWWFFGDINQASLFMPIPYPQLMNAPHIVLSQIMRTTVNIYSIFKRFYDNPDIPEPVTKMFDNSEITIGHHIMGPPICWIDIHSRKNPLIEVIIDLFATKGFQPNDLCVLPFIWKDKYKTDHINKEIDNYFVENGFKPRCVQDVEDFIENRNVSDFLISWGLRVKGLEFKVVVIVIDDEDLEISEAEDQKKIYIMASRCTCLLIFITQLSYKWEIDRHSVVQEYPFGLKSLEPIAHDDDTCNVND